MERTKLLKKYFDECIKTSELIDELQVETLINKILDTLRRRKTVLIYGQGILSTVAEHFSNDLLKFGGERIRKQFNKGFNVKCLNNSISLFTALNNDISYGEHLIHLIMSNYTIGSLILLYVDGSESKVVDETIKYCEKNKIDYFLIGHTNKLYDLNLNVKCISNNIGCLLDVMLQINHFIAYEINDRFKLPVVFIDRDGVINKNVNGYITNYSQIDYIDGSIEALKKLYLSGYPVVMITNQAGISKNILDEQQLTLIHNKMCQEIEANCGRIDKIYICPHQDSDKCDCRKPSNGMIEQAFRELCIDRENAYFIGDHITDIKAALKSNVKPIFVRSGRGNSKELDGYKNIKKCENLLEAVDIIDK